jgi:hypothetical protein
VTKQRQAEFALFKAEVERMLNLLGLQSWRVVILCEKLDGCYGDMSANCAGRIATIRYNSEPDTIATPEDPARVARHEVLELFLARIECLAQARYVTEIEIHEEKHALIRTLEKIL